MPPEPVPFQKPVFQEHPFQEHVELLQSFLAHRDQIVDGIEDILNAQRKPIQFLQDRAGLSRMFEACFYGRPEITARQSELQGRLEQAYCADGFEPRQLPGMVNDLIHPAEMMTRGFHFWHVTRWPGRKGRLHYAQTLFNVYMLRCLELLSMRIWDEGPRRQGLGDADPHRAGERLAQIQGLLDLLWKNSPAGQPAIVRDARWLIPLAQSLPTDDLEAYLRVARLAAEVLPESDALEVQRAHVRMLGGHLTSQIRHLCRNPKDGTTTSIDDPGVLLRTRTSNGLDFALLIQGLVALLRAYDASLEKSDEPTRLKMAGAIFQGISPDPELFLNRLDLLAAYSMIEHVFITADSEGNPVYSSLGQRHVALLNEYHQLIDRLAESLRKDFPRFRPTEGRYSPLGAIFGYPSNLTELMALKTLERDAETRFSLEDVFEDDTAQEDPQLAQAKLRWVDALRKMPHIDPEIQRQYDYPQAFAEELSARIARELGRHANLAKSGDHPRTGRLHIASEADTPSAIEDLPARYFASTDKAILAAHRAERYEPARFRHERQEANFLVSYETSGGGWMALKKDVLEEVLAAGRDARIAGLPANAAKVLHLMCANLVASPKK